MTAELEKEADASTARISLSTFIDRGTYIHVRLCLHVEVVISAVWAYVQDSFTEISRPYKKGKGMVCVSNDPFSLSSMTVSVSSKVLRLNACFAPYKVMVMPRDENDLNLDMVGYMCFVLLGVYCTFQIGCQENEIT